MLPILERLDGRIFISGPLREKVTRYFPGNSQVIPNGIDTGFFASRGIQPIPEFDDGHPNILFVGRMDERKGFRHLLHAYPYIKQRFPKVRLLVVGAYQPDEVASFVQYAHRHRLEDIHFIGKVTREDLRRYYQTASIFCAPSTGSESFGIILLEAMASGVPIVASDIVGYRSVLTHKNEGLLVEPGNELAVVQAITCLLENQNMRANMAAQGQQTARLYDWNVVAPRILCYYSELLDARAYMKREHKPERIAFDMQNNAR
jgi:phosphatidylinositol alpha-mannosyltransferase